MGIIKKYLIHLWHQAAGENNQNLAKMLEWNPKARALDLGCDDGRLAKERITRFVGTNDIYGVDIDEKVLKKAKKMGIKVVCQDLNQPLPLAANFFDIVQANQVIEHLFNTDIFLKEIFRVLKPGGYCLISTENLSSWHNLFSLFLGFQAPSQDISGRFRAGNPFSLCQARPRPWTAHQRVFTLVGLRSLLEAYGFLTEAILPAGYYPLPGFLAKFVARIDPLHSAFLAVKARKPDRKFITIRDRFPTDDPGIFDRFPDKWWGARMT